MKRSAARDTCRLVPDGLARGLLRLRGVKTTTPPSSTRRLRSLGGEIDVAGRIDQVDLTSFHGKVTAAA